MAGVQGNDGDDDRGNQHEESNKGRGPYVKHESQWITNCTGQEMFGFESREGGRLLESRYPFPL